MTRRALPSLNALKAFEVAARQESFVAAADELCVTAAAVSHQIKGLEDYLNVRLFERVGRRVELTKEGRDILPELQNGFNLIEQAVAKLDDEGRLLTVSSNPALAAKWLLPRIHLFNRQYPDIDVHLDASPRIASFEKDRIDVAIRFGSGNYPGMVSRPLVAPDREQVFPVCRQTLLEGKRPLTDARNLRYHTLLHDETLAGQNLVPNWKAWLEAAGFDGIDAERGLRFSNSVMAIEAAINGQGVALGCSFVVADDLAAQRLVKPFDLPFTLNSSYYLVYPEHKPSKKIDVFYDWLIAMCHDVLPVSD